MGPSASTNGASRVNGLAPNGAAQGAAGAHAAHAPFTVAEAGAVWEALVHDVDVPVAIYSAEGRLLFCNEHLAALGGWPASSIIGSLLSERLPPAIAAERLALIRRALSAPKPLLVIETMLGRELRSVYRAIPGVGDRPSVVLILPQLYPNTSGLGPEAERYEVVRPQHHVPGILSTLTPGEVEVLRLMAEGLSVEEIASRIHKSTKTVEYRRSALGRKLGVDNRVELTRFAIQHGLVKMTWGPNAIVANAPAAQQGPSRGVSASN